MAYKFSGVPKVFETKEQALSFLMHSPGYVKRRQKYLAKYWPGLLADVKGRSNKPTRASITKVGEIQSLRQRSAELRGEDTGSLLDTVGDVAAGAGKAASRWAKDQAAQTVGAVLYGDSGSSHTVNVPAKVQHASKVAEKVMPSPHTVETASDWTLGKGLTNLAQGQGPKNWQDVAGLGVGVAGILPIGKSVKGAAALKAAFKGGDKAADAGKVLPEAAWAGVGGKAAKGTPLGPKTLNETVQDALSGAPEAIAAQNKVYSQERAIRAKSAWDSYIEAGGGTAGNKAALGELKGALPVVKWNNAFHEFTPETLDGMIRQIWEESDLQLYEKIRASQGLERVVENRSPQASQLALIERVFGKETVDSLTSPESKGLFGDLYQKGMKLWNVPRTVMASFDISAPFRQGLVAGSRHPIVFAKNFKPMLKAFKSEEAFQGWLDELPNRANFQRYGRAKLNIQDVRGEYIKREEVFPGSYADPLPGIKHSARAYTAFLDKMRVDMFDYMIDVASQRGKNVDDEGFLKALGEYINTATGRGKIPTQHGENAAQFLNTFLFSPRLLASRFQTLNPNYYRRLAKQDKWVAAQALRATGQTIGSISAMVYLASMIPGASVGLDPRSANFGKVRIGNTRVDFAGGFQPLIVLYTRLLKKEYVSSTTGNVRKIDDGEYGSMTTWDLMWRFARTKLSPTTSLLVDTRSGEDLVGNPVTWQNTLWGMAPLNFQGGVEAYRQEGSIPAGIAAGALGSIGFGVNSYPDKAAPGGVASVRSSTRRSNPFRPSTRSNPFRP